MRFDTLFTRTKNGAGTALGSDSAPNTAPAASPADNMIYISPVNAQGFPIQRVEVGFTGPGGAPTLPATLYVYSTDASGTNGAWYQAGQTTSITESKLTPFEIPSTPVGGLYPATTLHLALVVSDNAAPDGTYKIGIAQIASSGDGGAGDASLAAIKTALDALNAAVSTATAQATGNASLASIKTDADTITALTGTIRHATTPTKADLATGPFESNRRGNVFMSATARCARKLPLATAAGAQTAGSIAAGASLAEGPCDGIEVDTDSLIVYMQNPERDPIAGQADVNWTAGAGWAIAGGVATHTGGGGTATLSQDTSATHAADPLLATEYYAVLYTVAGRTAGSTTAKIGTAAGGTYTANGTFLDIIQAQSAVISITPSTDFDGNITLTTIWAFGGTLPLFTGNVKAESAIKVICCASSATPGTINATAKVRANWYRRAGAVELT